MPKVINLFGSKSALVNVDVHPMFPQSIEDLGDELLHFFFTVRHDENVIKVDVNVGHAVKHSLHSFCKSP